MAEDDDVVYGPTTVPRWSYAASKAIDEYLALAHHRTDGLPVVIVRLFNTVGPRQSGEYGMVLPRFVRRALANEPLEVYGNGHQSRCFCDVRDVIPALISLMETKETNGRVFNLGHDDPIEIGTLASLVVQVLQSESSLVNIGYETAFDASFEDLAVRKPDLSRIRSAIDFKPRFGLEASIVDLARSMDSGVNR